jgi:Predicted amidohydrolase
MKIALSQMNIKWEDKDKNKAKVLAFINEAKELNVELIVFPEMTLTGFSMNVEKIAESNRGETIQWFENIAKCHNINIGFGVVEKTESEFGKNKFIIINDEGVIISDYTKLHPFSYGLEDKYYKSGDSIELSKVNDFTVATFICYDLRFPEVFQLASNQAQLIIVAANWPQSRKEHWITLLKARAIENQCYILGVNRVGNGNNIYYSGNSMVVAPDGSILIEIEDEEKLLIYDIDIKESLDLRNVFPVKKDRKINIYKKYL